MVLWQRLATCSFAPDWAGNLQSATVFPGILHLQKRCCLLKLRQFWQKGSLQQSHFRGRRHIGFLDSKKWSSPVALKACFKQNPTLIHLRHAKSFVFRAARKVPHCQKWDCHALPLFALERAIPRLFSMSILIAGETKNGHAKSTRWSVWQPCFWGCDMTLGRPQLFQKFTRNNDTTKGRKDDTNMPRQTQKKASCADAMLRKPATTTPKQFQTTWCFPDWAGNLQSATVFPGILHLQKRCCLLKLRQFWQKGSLQQSHFRGRRHIGFLDSKKWSSPVALKACFKQNPTLIHLRHAKSFVFRAARKVPHCQKWDCHALPLFALERAIPRLFSMSILIAGETKNGHAKSTRWSVWQPCFWGCDMTLGRPQLFQKFTRNNDTTKGRKDDTNIHVLNWGGPPSGVQILYTFPTPKTGMKTNRTI